ncbi:DedA family protein [Patulibacter sp. SYSU D01012]|uniref:DedA family protein n=1 Tax=Patulibacter sp. SYSU D01012 TaxID=2817381 RepID=UPI001B313370|nr:DedA family protein [Patulibacter sp. SYSU D01012]
MTDTSLGLTALPLAETKPAWLALVVLAPAVVLVARRRGHRPGWLLPLAAVAVLVGVLVGAGIVHIPSIEDLPLQEWIGRVGDTLGNWAYVIVGVLAFLETGAFVGLVAPGETFVILGGVLAGEGTLAYGTLLATVWAAAFCGDLASFWLGRRLGRSFLVRHGSKVKITPDRLEHVERFLEKHGGKAIVIGRFIGFVRAVAPFVLGSSGVGWRRFVPYAVIGSGLWSALFVTLGYVFWQSLDRLLSWVKQGALAFGIVVAVVVGIIAAVHWLGEEEHREQARDWLRRAGETRAGRVALAVWRPISGPAGFAWRRITPGGLGLEVTTLLAVLAVGAFGFFALEAHLDHSASTLADRSTLRWAQDLAWGPAESLAHIGTTLGSWYLVGGLVLVAAGFLAGRGRVGTAVALVAASGLTFLVTALVRSGEDRAAPASAVDVVTSTTFPSTVGAAAAVWVAIAVAVSPTLGRIPGRIGLTGLAAILATLIGGAPLVLRTAYLSDVLAGAGLAAAVLSAVGIVAMIVGHIRQTAAG